MPLLINLRHLEKKDIQLKGLLAVEDLDISNLDELVHVLSPVEYDLEVGNLDKDLLVQGSLRLSLECECVRCLKKFKQDLDFPEWTCHLPLEGEDKAEVNGDFVDLTPYIREDILLAFPQHPLCKAECAGLPKGSATKLKKVSGAGKFDETSSAWAELNKLKL